MYRIVLNWLRMDVDPRRSLGRRGERAAAKHLKRQGYRMVARNLRCRVGEIDLLALAPDGRTVVVVEVKTGRGGALPPELRVGAAKQRKLMALAVQLVRRYRLHNRPVRFDVVGVDLPERGPAVVRHHAGAFEARV